MKKRDRLRINRKKKFGSYSFIILYDASLSCDKSLTQYLKYNKKNNKWEVVK